MMAFQQLNIHWCSCVNKLLLTSFLFHASLVSSFDLNLKSIYLFAGSNDYNVDPIYPFSPNDSSGKVGGRSGAVTWMDHTGTAWIFGGISDNAYLNDMWRFSDGVWYWMTGSRDSNFLGTYNGLEQPGLPANREGASSWIDSAGDLWLFGGRCYLSDSIGTKPLNDLWKFNISSRTWTWISGSRSNESMIPRPNIPNSRSKASSWSHGNKLYLFGGLLADFSTTNDLWMFDVNTRNWTLVDISQDGFYQSPVGFPPPRAGASVYADANNAWVFGGKTKDGNYLSDLWHYTEATDIWAWVAGQSFTNDNGTYPTALGSPGNPPSREGACSWFDVEGYLWIYGGYRQDKNESYYYGDFWKIDVTLVTTFLWQGTSNATEYPSAVNMTGGPGPRSYAACWMNVGGDMFFYGGNTSMGNRNDAWVIDMDDCAINNGGCYTNCTNVLAGPNQCTPCPSGTRGDGHSPCIDFDACSINNGGCDILTNCTNNVNGTPTCSACPKGYNGTGYTGCKYFDECSVNHGGCDPKVTCTSGVLAARPICGPCPIGYNGTGNTSCVDFNECSVNNGGCDILTNCTNYLNAIRPTCSDCPRPYYTGNGATGCKDINECAINKGGCDPLTKCINNIGKPPTCGPCPQYYTGNGDTGCVDLNECSVNNGGCMSSSVCTNNVGAPPTCGPCTKGFIGNNYCSGSRGSTNAGLVAGVTIGGFVVLLGAIGLIFYFTNDKSVKKGPSKPHLSPEYTNKFELQTMSQA